MAFINRKELGGRGERLASDYLKQAGLSVLCRNFQCKRGEVDLICRDGDTLVFIEVRYRKHSGSSARYGNSLETVDWRKQRKIINAAKYYLQSHRLGETLSCRFDVIGLDRLSSGTGTVSIAWIRDAFQVTS